MLSAVMQLSGCEINLRPVPLFNFIPDRVNTINLRLVKTYP